MNNRTRCLRQQITKAQAFTLSLLSHSRLYPFNPNTPSSIIIISQLIKTRFSIFFFFFMFQLRQPTNSIIASLNISQPQFLSLRCNLPSSSQISSQSVRHQNGVSTNHLIAFDCLFSYQYCPSVLFRRYIHLPHHHHPPHTHLTLSTFRNHLINSY